MESTIRTPAKKPLPLAALIGGAVALIVVIAGAVMMSGGNQTEGGATGPGAPAAGTPYFSAIAVKVYEAADEETHMKYALGEITPDQLPELQKAEKIKPLVVTLQVVDPEDKSKTYSYEKAYTGDTLEVADAPSFVAVQILVDGQTEPVYESDFRAGAEKETIQPDPIVLKPAGAS